jgi:hypothetical protein
MDQVSNRDLALIADEIGILLRGIICISNINLYHKLVRSC